MEILRVELRNAGTYSGRFYSATIHATAKIKIWYKPGERLIIIEGEDGQDWIPIELCRRITPTKGFDMGNRPKGRPKATQAATAARIAQAKEKSRAKLLAAQAKEKSRAELLAAQAKEKSRAELLAAQAKPKRGPGRPRKVKP